ncbi:MAG: beta-propeller fold lactonase family protein [Terracidiphilus sp.]
MKFNKSRQLLLVSAASLLAAGCIAACGTATVDFVFVASAKGAGTNNWGEIDVFEINGGSGYMRQIPTSPFPSQGRTPVAEAVATDYMNLYVVNQADNDIVQFMIGSDGKLYPQNTENTPGTYPLALAVNATNLFVLDTYQGLSNCSNASPCSGSVGVFQLLPATTDANPTPSGALGPIVANGSLNYWPLCLSGYVSSTNSTQCAAGSTDVLVPTAMNILASGAYIYVTAFDWTAAGGPAKEGNYEINGTVGICNLTPNVYSGPNGYIFGFTVGSTGALTPLNNGVPVAAGTLPCGITSDTTAMGTYVYVTDAKNGNVLSYSVSSGALTPLGGPIPAGNQPTAIVADPTLPYLYVANTTDGTVSAYSISSGVLSNIGTYNTEGQEPVAMGIDPGTKHYLFTVNFLGDGTGVNGKVSDFYLSPTAGTLINAQHSPYTSNAEVTAVAAIPHDRTQK